MREICYGLCRTVALFMAAVLVLASCDSPVSPPIDTTPPASNVFAVMGIPRGIDEHYLDVASKLLGYGGHYFDQDGRLVVYMMDTLAAPLVRAVISPELETYRRNRGISSPGIVVKPAQFEFLALTRWRASHVPRAVNGVSGVYLVGTSKRSNRIAIGIADAAVENQVRRNLIEQGVPLDAVTFWRMREPQQTREFVDSLTRWTSTLQAGRRIWSTAGYNGSAGPCSAGFIGLGKPGTAFAGSYYMLTASHCTRSYDGIHGTDFKQPDGSSGYIGYEEWDGNRFYGTWQGYICYYGEGCRLSDAALIRVTGRDAALGVVARPKSVGSLEISSTSPHLFVSGYDGYWTHIAMHMIGSASGLQHGEVIDSDFDIRWNDGQGGYIWTTQTSVSDHTAKGGDSGGPIFTKWSGTQVELRGVQVGLVDINGSVYGVFSNMQSFHAEMVSRWNVYPAWDIDWYY